MGRRKKNRRQHLHACPQPSPDHGERLPGELLLEGDLIRKGDEFFSGTQWHPVSATVGNTYMKHHPPMRRGLESMEGFVSERHQLFLDMLEMAGFILPNQFKNWTRFFLDEGNFLDEAERWMSGRLQGRWPKIEDDVDKGLMKPTPYIPYRPTSYQKANSGWSDDDDYWTSWQGWQGGSGKNYWKEPSLPLTPKLPAPSGLSGAELVVM